MQRVLILEDDSQRIFEMLRVAEHELSHLQPTVFDSAPALIDFLRAHAGEIVLMSLDHDLYRCTSTSDPGDGRCVTDFLRQLPPFCPVIVHSSNYAMASVMIEHLKSTGWEVRVVTPFSETEYGWITSAWRDTLRELLRSGWISTPNVKA